MAAGAQRGVVFRCDGSAMIGTGHVQRCLVLAHALARRGWSVGFAARELVGAPFEPIRRARYPLQTLSAELSEAEDRDLTLQILKAQSAPWLVVDRYAARAEDLQAISESGRKLLAIDDIGEHAFPVDVLVNQNANGPELSYRTRADTIRLLGTRFALVGDAYAQARPNAPPSAAKCRRILVFLGGGETLHAMERVLAGLRLLAQDAVREIRIVVGGESQARAMAANVAELAGTRLEYGLANLVEPLGWADLFVTAGGSVAWEACCLGVPMLIVTVAANQEQNAAKLHALGAAVHLGRIADTSATLLASALRDMIADEPRLCECRESAWQLVDGLGAERVADAMEQS